MARTPRSGTAKRNLRGFAALAALAFFLAGLTTASAAEHIYEDSFGNLIVQSDSGYKRIVVGWSDGVAAQVGGAYGAKAASKPRVIYADRIGRGSSAEPDSWREPRRGYDVGCSRKPVLLHGRSYMYGLPDNVVPVPAGLCR
jgi:hypothetical protein